jgi:hypothetical protein
VSIFRFEYQTDLGIEECGYRLTEDYFEKSRSEGVRYYVDDRQLWELGLGKTRKGEIRLGSYSTRFAFYFVLALREHQGKTRILCKHNPFRFFAWGKFMPLLVAPTILAFPAALAASAPLTATLIPGMIASIILTSPFAILCAIQEASARKIVIKYLEKALEAKPCIPPKKRRHILPGQFRP